MRLPVLRVPGLSPRPEVRDPQTLDDAVAGLGLLAGTANVIMQLARPEVGYGVVESPVESGNVVLHPIKRARTTFTYLAVSIWGTEEERRDYRHAVNGSHRQIRSTENSPVEYNAFDPRLQLWVAACLYRGLEDVHRALNPGCDVSHTPRVYEEGKRMGTTLQVRYDLWPDDHDAFDQWWSDQLALVSIDDTVRNHLMKLVELTMAPWPVRVAMAPVQRFFTTGFLEPTFRDQMQLPWTDADQASFDRVLGLLGELNARMPAVVRHFPLNMYLLDFRLRRRMGRLLV